MMRNTEKGAGKNAQMGATAQMQERKHKSNEMKVMGQKCRAAFYKESV